jgi:nucleoside phosphorylase
MLANPEAKNEEYPYYVASLKSNSGLELTIAGISCAHMGAPDAAKVKSNYLHAYNVYNYKMTRLCVNQLHPRLIVMIGICAGDPKKCHLGDIIVAKTTFSYDKNAKEEIEKDDKGQEHKVMKYNTRTYTVFDAIASRVSDFIDHKPKIWKEYCAKLGPKPESMKSVVDKIIKLCCDKEDGSMTNAEIRDKLKNIRNYEAGMKSLISKKVLDRINGGFKLQNPPDHYDSLSLTGDFPHNDPEELRAYSSTMAQTSYVSTSRPFSNLKIPVRDTLAVEMEGDAFYESLRNYPDTFWRLVVKGVCDYADQEKDDSYHEYAGQAAAAFVFSFIKTYVTKDMPKGVIL